MNNNFNPVTIPIFSFVPPKYKYMIRKGPGVIFLAILILITIYAAVSSIRMNVIMNDFVEEVYPICPEFELKNGKFDIDEPIEFSEEGTYFLATNEIPGMSQKELSDYLMGLDEPVATAIVIGTDTITMFSNNQFQSYDFKQIKGTQLDKDSAFEYINTMVMPFTIIMFALILVFYIGIYYLAAAIIQFVAYIANSAGKKELAGNELFRLTLIAKIPVFIIFRFGGMLGLNVSMFVEIIVLIVYMVVCVLAIKDDEPEALPDNSMA
ncbi:MAG: DUF1189 domain-containing protein [Lachnospiraceae bacterium]|nr:DUF1189 domain-containing protein [Lachnospiraceae bacterium]